MHAFKLKLQYCLNIYYYFWDIFQIFFFFFPETT